VHRVELFAPLHKVKRARLNDVVSVMNGAATQDARNVELMPVLADVMQTSAPPNDRAARMRDLLLDWLAKGSSRLDLQPTQGPGPAAWRAGAVGERISVQPGPIPDTMRWTNRPTFQQVNSFDGHRPRRQCRHASVPNEPTSDRGPRSHVDSGIGPLPSGA
jgi:hypothetical protein